MSLKCSIKGKTVTGWKTLIIATKSRQVCTSVRTKLSFALHVTSDNTSQVIYLQMFFSIINGTRGVRWIVFQPPETMLSQSNSLRVNRELQYLAQVDAFSFRLKPRDCWRQKRGLKDCCIRNTLLVSASKSRKPDDNYRDIRGALPGISNNCTIDNSEAQCTLHTSNSSICKLTGSGAEGDHRQHTADVDEFEPSPPVDPAAFAPRVVALLSRLPQRSTAAVLLVCVLHHTQPSVFAIPINITSKHWNHADSCCTGWTNTKPHAAN